MQTYNDVYIEYVSIVTINCKQGETESIEYYRVLGIFSKYYNNLFFYIGSNKIIWNKYFKKYKVLARLIQKDNTEYKKFQLEKDGYSGPKYMFYIKHICEILTLHPEFHKCA